MQHPWLEIPIADYEAHMSLPSIGQAPLLGAVLQRTVAAFRPRSLAVLGVAGGNGLETIVHSGVQRVVALDFNPDFLALCSQRFAASFDQFEPVLHDLSQGPPPVEPVDCVFAGLVLEYLDAKAFCAYLPSIIAPQGYFATLLQLPSPTLPEVSPSPFISLQRLEKSFCCVAPDALDEQLAVRGFLRVASQQYELVSGKSFHYAAYQAQIAAQT